MNTTKINKIKMSEDIINIQNYIIESIRKEDIELIIQREDDNKEHSNRIEEKIGITSTILNNVSMVTSMEDFYEEECQLSLLTWAYEIYYINSVSEREIDRKSLEILLFNILNIFEIFPIKPKDLISLNFIEKLNKIKRSIKKWNYELSLKISNIVKYWKSMITYYRQYENDISSQVSFNLLSHKREREENSATSTTLSSEGDSERCSSIKKVTFKEYFIDVSLFDPSQPPMSLI